MATTNRSLAYMPSRLEIWSILPLVRSRLITLSDSCLPICSQIMVRSEQATTMPWVSAMKMWFPVLWEMELRLMPRAQLLRLSFWAMAEAMRETSPALFSMLSRYSSII